MIAINIEKVIKKILETKANSVLIQLPDGLKPRAKEITDKIEAETNAKVYIHLGTCFGACDIPNFKPDLLIQFGHSEWI